MTGAAAEPAGRGWPHGAERTGVGRSVAVFAVRCSVNEVAIAEGDVGLAVPYER